MGAATTTAERPEPTLGTLPDPKLGFRETATRLAHIALLVAPAFAAELAPEGSTLWRWAPLLRTLWIGGLLAFAALNADRLGVRRPAVTYALVPYVNLVATPLLAWRLVSMHDPYWTGSLYPRRWQWWHRAGAILGAVLAVGFVVEGVKDSLASAAMGTWCAAATSSRVDCSKAFHRPRAASWATARQPPPTANTSGWRCIYRRRRFC